MGRTLVGGTIVLYIILSVTGASENIAWGQKRSERQQKANKRGTFMKDLTRQELTERATRLGSPVHTALEKPETVVERVPTPFFATGAIYRISTRPPDRPRTYIIGVWESDKISVLNGSTANFYDLVAGSGLKLVSGDDYVTYIMTFLDSTRDFTGGVQVLNSIDESWWLPKPTPEEIQRRVEITQKYTGVVAPPHLSRDAISTVMLFVIRDRALLQLQAKVAGDGRIEFTEKVLEPKMPTIILN